MAGYPGMDGGGTDPLLGGDPVLSGPEAGMHFLSSMMDAATGQQRDGLMNGRLEEQAAVIIEGMLTHLVTGALRQMSNSTQWRPVVEGISELVSELGPSGMGGIGGLGGGIVPTAKPEAQQPPDHAVPAPDMADPSAKHRGAPSADPSSETTGGAHRADDGRPVYSAPEQASYTHPRQAFSEAREATSKMTMGQIAKKAAEPLARRVNDTSREWVGVRLETDPESEQFGDWVSVKEGERVEGLRHVDNATGDTLDQIVEGDPRYEGLAGRVARRQGLRTLASGVLAGQGVAGSLGAGLARVAGPVGIAVGAAQAGSNWLESQQKSSEPFRQMYGEQTSPFAARERFGEWMSGIAGFGTIGTETARQQYRAASEMGLTDDGREQATGFMGDMQRRFGINTQQSAAIVQSTLDQGDGVGALDDFAEAITNVSRAAVEAGRTSSEAIGEFVSAQATLARLTPGSGASTQLASGLTQMTYEMPQSLSKALGGASGLAQNALTQSNVMQMAALAGQSPTEALFNMADPSSTFAQGAMTMEGISNIILRQTAAFLGMSEADLKQRLSSAQSGGKLSDEEQMAAVIDLAGDRSRAGQLLMMLSNLTSRYLGESAPPQSELINFLFELGNGAFTVKPPEESTSAGDPTERGKAPAKTGNATWDAYAEALAPGEMDYDKISKPEGQAANYGPQGQAWNSQRNEILKNLGMLTVGAPPNTNGAEDSVSAYVESVGKTGSGDATLEMLLNPRNRADVLKHAGVDSLDEATFRIDGKEMTLAEAISAGKGSQIAGASIINEERPHDQPTSVSVVLDLSPDAKDVLIANGSPTADQKSGTPPSGSLDPGSVRGGGA